MNKREHIQRIVTKMMRGPRACHARKQLRDPGTFHPEWGKLKETLIVRRSETHRVRRLGLFFYH